MARILTGKAGVMAAVMLLCSVIALADPDLAVAQSGAERLTNADVVELHKLGLGDDVVLEKLRASAADFDVSLDGLKKLKAAGVSAAIIAEMVRVSRKAGDDEKAAKASEVSRNDPTTSHPGGIYYWDASAGDGQLVMLEPAVYSQSRSGGMFKSAMTFGIAKMKSKAVLSGARANLAIAEARPTFYFYFEPAPTNAGLSGSGMGYFQVATSANEFLMVRTETKENSRELIVGQMNAFGAQGGVMDKAVHPFEFEKLGTGIYRVRPKTDLPPGEYCFFYAGSAPMATYGLTGPAGGGKVFDFGVK